MDYSSLFYTNETSLCVDPKVLVYGAGEGINEPHYNPPNLDEEAIDLQQTDQQSFHTHNDASAHPDWVTDEDADHESIDEFPITTWASTLDPQAPVFVPASQTEPGMPTSIEEEARLEPLHPVESPPTPRIKVSCPNDPPPSSIGRARDDTRRKSLSQSRQSSPIRRSPSISRPRASSSGRKASPIPKAAATRLITELGDLPANRPYAYNVGDRTSPLLSLHTHASYPPPIPGQGHPYPSMPGLTAGPVRPGYACSHEGCPESSKRWDTKSDRDHHERKHVPVDRRAHACEHCGKTFHFPKDLNRHMVVHDGSKVICWICNKAYSRNDNLKRHIKTQHGRAGSMGNSSQMSAPSPTPSLVTSFTQSPIDDTGRNTPLNLSPLAAKSSPWSKYAHNPHDSGHESHSQPESPLFATPMSKSFSNRT